MVCEVRLVGRMVGVHGGKIFEERGQVTDLPVAESGRGLTLVGLTFSTHAPRWMIYSGTGCRRVRGPRAASDMADPS